MISMMYLVLTALLALNVSKDILDAFVIVNDGLTKTTENFNAANQGIYQEFDKQYQLSKTKVEKWKNKADEVKKKADELFAKFDEFKLKILTTAGEDEAIVTENGKTRIDGLKIAAKDNTDVPAQIMITEGGGAELKKLMDEFRTFLISLVKESKGDDNLMSSLEVFLNTNEHTDEATGEVHPWESYNFEHLPMIAVITIMSKIQGDIRNSEAKVINFLMQQISGDDIPFNKVDAIVYSPSTDIISGGDYQAQIFIAAYDTLAKPEFYIGKFDKSHKLEGTEGTDWWKLDSVANGKGFYKVPSPSVGIKEYTGFIKLPTPKGDKYYDFSAGYKITPPSAAVSPTKMMVFYIGVDNPVKVSAAGIPPDKVQAVGQGCTLSPKGNGEYIARVKAGKECFVSVSGEVGGKNMSFGREKFIIKRIPDPIPGIGGRKNGEGIARSSLAAGSFIYARRPDGFDFECTFKVLSFSLSVDVGGTTKEEKANGAAITGGQAQLISKVKIGGNVVFKNIKAVGPDGEVRNLTPLVFSLQ
ncbi:MAG: hypothetical protein A2281_00695 [Bacteroidetes bacterium RIFOXYA12_FULL_38_20]|nr:MAG: hypothetical protein A2281_00695 [Bacteroidetes bacterium RIFOXYA12_FULL_38_20]